MALVYSPRYKAFSWIQSHTLTRHLPCSLDSAETGFFRNILKKLNRTTHSPVTFADCTIRYVMFIHQGHTQTNAPTLCTLSALYLPAPTYLGDKENSRPVLFHMSAWIYVCAYSWVGSYTLQLRHMSKKVHFPCCFFSLLLSTRAYFYKSVL